MPDILHRLLSWLAPDKGQSEEVENFQMSVPRHFTPPSTASGHTFSWTRPTSRCARAGCIVRLAAIVAVPVTIEGKRQIVSLHIGPREAEPFWSTFLRDLWRSGLRGVELVLSDAREGPEAAITRVVGATWQRCGVHFMRNALAHVPKRQNTMVAAAIRQVFFQLDHAAATQTWRHVADQLRSRWPTLGAGRMLPSTTCSPTSPSPNSTA